MENFIKEEKTFENVKEYLEFREFKIHIAFQDTRADEGDDGSYGIFLTERKDKFYVQVFHLSFYANIDDIIACEEDDCATGFPDYVSFNTQQGAIIFIKRFMQTLLVFKTLEEFQCLLTEKFEEELDLELYWRDAEDFRQILEDDNYLLNRLKILDSIDKNTLSEWLAICLNPFSGYFIQDIRRMNEIIRGLGYSDYRSIIEFDLHALKMFEIK